MTDQQNQTVQLTSDAEPTAAKISESVVGVSQRSVENGNPNKDNDLKASTDKRAKKLKKTCGFRERLCSKNEVEENWIWIEKERAWNGDATFWRRRCTETGIRERNSWRKSINVW